MGGRGGRELRERGERERQREGGERSKMLIGMSKGERRGRGEERKREHTYRTSLSKPRDCTCHNYKSKPTLIERRGKIE